VVKAEKDVRIERPFRTQGYLLELQFYTNRSSISLPLVHRGVGCKHFSLFLDPFEAIATFSGREEPHEHDLLVLSIKRPSSTVGTPPIVLKFLAWKTRCLGPG
jgi:hypothetical protein